MHRTTVLLPQALKARATLRARKRGISLGEFVRECLSAALNNPMASDRSDNPPLADSPVYDGPAPSDLAEQHDHYLYDE